MIAHLGQLVVQRRGSFADHRAADSFASAESRLIASLHPRQRDFVLDPARRIAALVGRGGGKTTGGLARFIRRMLRQDRAQCLYIAQTRDSARELIWEDLKDYLERLEIAADFNETRMTCSLRQNGSRLRLVGADDRKEIDKLRGKPRHEVGIDEAASHDPKLFHALIYKIIGPRLGDFKGMLWAVGTPGEFMRDLFYEITRDGSTMSRPFDDRELTKYQDWKGWSFHRWTLQDGAAHVKAIANLWEEALAEKEQNGWSDDNPIWLREYMARWVEDNSEAVYKYRAMVDGKPWNQWDPPRESHGEGELAGFAVPPIKDPLYVVGVDMGHNDPTGVVVKAYSPTDPARKLYHCWEFESRGMYARNLAELFLGESLSMESPGGLFGRIGWPDAIEYDAAGLGDAVAEELATVYGIRMRPVDKATKGKFSKIEAYNGDLIDGRLQILKGSKLEAQLQSLQWVVDDWGKLKEHKGQRNDLTDASLYARTIAGHLLAGESPAANSTKMTRRKIRETFEEDEGETEFIDPREEWVSDD